MIMQRDLPRYSSILVAVGGSEFGTHLLRESVRLAQWNRGAVTAVSVAPPYEGDLRLVGVKSIKNVLREPCERFLDEVEKIAESHGASIKAVFLEGEPHEKIVALAEAENSDLIVVGAGRLCSIFRALMGSVAARVIKHSRKDVLVLRSDTPIGWEKILVSTDGTEYGERVVDRARNLAAAHGAELIVVYIVGAPSGPPSRRSCSAATLKEWTNECAQELKGRAEIPGTKYTALVREGDAPRVIADVAREQGANIIITGSCERKGIKRLLRPCAVERIIRASTCPVLVVKPLPSPERC